MSALQLDLSAIRLRIGGLPGDLAERLEPKWGAFRSASTHGIPVDVEVVCDAAQDGSRVRFGAKDSRSTVEGDRVRFTMPEGSVTAGPSGPIAIHVQGSSAANQAFGFLNLLMAGLAWRLPYHRALLLHAAGLVVDGRAFLLVGGEGAGKSTWAELGRQAGAGVLSDDLVLVHDGGRGFDAMATPFRVPMNGPVLTGRWPIGAILGAAHATSASLREDPPLIVKARLAANLPYAVDGFARHDALLGLLDRLAVEAPHRTLAFARDASFVALLRGA